MVHDRRVLFAGITFSFHSAALFIFVWDCAPGSMECGANHFFSSYSMVIATRNGAAERPAEMKSKEAISASGRGFSQVTT